MLTLEISTLFKINKDIVIIGTESNLMVIYDFGQGTEKVYRLGRLEGLYVDKLVGKRTVNICDIKVDYQGRIVFADFDRIYSLDINTGRVDTLGKNYTACSLW